MPDQSLEQAISPQEIIDSRPIADASVLVLAITAFAAGLSEFIVIGLIAQITQAYNVDLASGGLLVAAYALGVSIGAPLLTLLSLGKAARSLAALLIGVFALVSFVTTLAPDFVWLIALRVIAGALHGVYFAITTASLPTLFDEKRAPMALALMFSGLTVAMVAGVPLGMFLAASLGWAIPFIMIGGVAAIGAILLPLVLPQNFGKTETPSIYILVDAALRFDLLRPYAFTILGFGGGFVFFTYAEPWLTGAASLSDRVTSVMFGLVGLGALAGNILGGALPHKFGRSNALKLLVLIQMGGLSLLAWNHSIPVITLGLILWSIGAFATAPMVHGWAIAIADATNARVAASLNITAFNIGLSISAMIAGRQVAAFGIEGLPLTSLFIVALALPICFSIEHTRKPS